MNLPDSYVERMRKLLGDEDYAAYEQSLSLKPTTGIRINLRKISIEEFEKLSPFEIKKIPYTHNGYYVNDTDAVSKHPYYFAGLYYIQESSAMVPAANANLKKGDCVLDLCASPGGKTTELLSQNPGFLLSNDISYSRCIPLVKNIDLFGSGSVLVSAQTPQMLENIYEETFDVILVDAPCSGEGMFRKDPSLIKSWREKGPEYYQPIQIEILNSAIKMLKKGGHIIYSTCTFSMLEDEEVLSKILAEHKDIVLEYLPKQEGFCPGYSFKERDYSECIRLFPHKIKGEGHFVARLRKLDDGLGSSKKRVNDKNSQTISYEKLPDSVKEFLSHINKERLCEDYIISNDCVYMIPKNALPFFNKKVRYVRTGVMLGQLKNNIHFTPHNSIALYLRLEDFDNIIDLSKEDKNITKYLKGETLILDNINVKKGYVLMCVDGFPLGFLKFDGSKYKNLYSPGWRLNGN